MNRWRTPALLALWLQVAATFTLASYALWHGGLAFDSWLNALESFLAGLLLAWWTGLFTRLTRTPPETTPPQDGTWRALALLYPWLTALRLSLWGMTLLGLLAGLAPEANPVALTALMTLWGGAIWASNASNAGVLRLAAEPASAPARRQLLDWLNLLAALSLAMTVMNVVPIAGYSSAPDQTSQLVYGVEGLIEVGATLLALLALRGGAEPAQPAPPIQKP